MNKKLKNIIKYIVFILIGIVLFWFAYRKQDFSELWIKVKTVNYWVFIFGFLFAIISHICRARRWQMLLDTDVQKTRFSNCFLAVLNGYFANLAIPRSGELARCAQIAKYDNINFSKVVGTMVSERIIDVLLMVLITIVTILLQTAEIKKLINETGLSENLENLLNPTIIIIIFLLGIVFCVFLYLLIKGRFNRWKIFEKISNFIKGFWEGLISLKNLKKPFWFIFHSIVIWICYFLEFYTCFFAFDGAISELKFIVPITAFIASSYAMLAPSPNGLGAYHFMVIQTLIVYGIMDSDANAFALVAHGMQTIYIIILGIFSVICTVFLSPANKEKS